MTEKYCKADIIKMLHDEFDNIETYNDSYGGFDGKDMFDLKDSYMLIHAKPKIKIKYNYNFIEEFKKILNKFDIKY